MSSVLFSLHSAAVVINGLSSLSVKEVAAYHLTLLEPSQTVTVCLKQATTFQVSFLLLPAGNCSYENQGHQC